MTISIHLVRVAVCLIRFVYRPCLWHRGSYECNDLLTSFRKYTEMRLVHVDESVLTQSVCSVLIKEFINKIYQCYMLDKKRCINTVNTQYLSQHSSSFSQYCCTELPPKDSTYTSAKIVYIAVSAVCTPSHLFKLVYML